MTVVPVYKIRIVYKSGYTHDFEVYDFTINRGTYEWKYVSETNKPVLIGVDDIAAIYQIGVRKKVRFG